MRDVDVVSHSSRCPLAVGRGRRTRRPVVGAVDAHSRLS